MSHSDIRNIEDFWRPIINDFNPVGTVRPELVQRFFVDRNENDPTRSLIQQLQLDIRNKRDFPADCKCLLTGHTGSGKSSELMRLAQLLAGDFFVVWFDAELSLSRPNHFDVILGMGLAAHLAAQMADLRPSDKLANKLVKSLANFIHKYEDRRGFTLKLEQVLKQIFAMFVGAGASAAAGPIGAAAAMLGATQLELKVGDDLVRTLELPANRQEIIGALNDILLWVQHESGRPLLMVVDGLDKVELSQAHKLFADSTLLREPACALIYAAPIELYCRPSRARQNFTDYHLLPIVPVHKRPPTGENWKAERQPDDDQLEVMRRLVAKRLESHGLTLDQVISTEAMALLAQMSGGVMRELIRHFHNAARNAQLQGKTGIDAAAARRVIEKQRAELDITLTLPHRQGLRTVLQQGFLSGGASAEVEDAMIRDLHLLRYENNGISWFDAHPNALTLL